VVALFMGGKGNRGESQADSMKRFGVGVKNDSTRELMLDRPLGPRR
jgi:hypothetical protein